MELSTKMLSMLYGTTFDLKIEDFQELKRFYSCENKNFVKVMDKVFGEYKKKEDIEKFLFLLLYLKDEIKDISPFLSGNINRLFVLMIKNNYFKQIAQYSDILESCANIKVLELLNDFTKSRNMGKFLTNVEIYKLKKLVFDLSNKYKKDEIAYQIEVALEKNDSEWLENIEK